MESTLPNRVERVARAPGIHRVHTGNAIDVELIIQTERYMQILHVKSYSTNSRCNKEIMSGARILSYMQSGSAPRSRPTGTRSDAGDRKVPNVEENYIFKRQPPRPRNEFNSSSQNHCCGYFASFIIMISCSRAAIRSCKSCMSCIAASLTPAACDPDISH